MNAAEFDDVRIAHLRRHQRQLQRVADEIGDLENLRPVIVVRDDHCIALALERADLFVQRLELLDVFARVFVSCDSRQLVVESTHFNLTTVAPSDASSQKSSTQSKRRSMACTFARCMPMPRP